jgi:HD superfamily phosphohydrolase YqeK
VTRLLPSKRLAMHPLLADAAAGTLPPWAEASAARRKHMRRVADLMERWAVPLGRGGEVGRWRAAGMLHDALRDGDPGSLLTWVPPEMREAPVELLHGPAAAARLAVDGVADAALLLAVSYHTLGHPDLDLMGRALYVADYVEPGRLHDPDRLARLRERMPQARDRVLLDVAAARMTHALALRQPLHDVTVRFWNGLARPAAGRQEAARD